MDSTAPPLSARRNKSTAESQLALQGSACQQHADIPRHLSPLDTWVVDQLIFFLISALIRILVFSRNSFTWKNATNAAYSVSMRLRGSVGGWPVLIPKPLTILGIIPQAVLQFLKPEWVGVVLEVRGASETGDSEIGECLHNENSEISD